MSVDPITGREVVYVDHYQSGDFPSGSIAVLKDGRLLVTQKAFDEMWQVYRMYLRGELRTNANFME